MLSLTDRAWGKFLISDVAEIEPGESLPKKKMVKGLTPFISARQEFNGVDCFVGNENSSLESDCISLNNTGSVGFCFYHPYSALYSNNISKLRPVVRNKYTSLFLCVAIRSQAEKYSYGYVLAVDRIRRQKILLPVDDSGNPDWGFMESYMRQKELLFLKPIVEKLGKRLAGKRDYGKIKWENFPFDEVLSIKSGTRLTKDNMKEGDIPFVGATEKNNGVTSFTGTTNASFDGNVLGVNYNGSVASSFYHPYSAVFSDDVKRVCWKQASHNNKYSLLFLSTLISSQKDKYGYGYKFNARRMSGEKILLPVDDSGNLAWEYMENCAKNAENKILAEYLSLVRDRISSCKVK